MRTLVLLLLSMVCSQGFCQSLIITGHRGAAGLAPENTLSSVRKGLELGADRVEIDVQQTSDGTVVVMHDPTIDRTTNMQGTIKDMTWLQLSKALANKGFEQAYPDEHVPTLESVIKLVDGSAELVIEIKEGNETYPGIEDHVAGLIGKYHAEGWAVIHSFNDDALYYLHSHYPEIRLQKLFVAKVPWLPILMDTGLRIANLSDYDFVEAFGVHRSFVNQQLVDRVHRLGKKIHVWTVNDDDDLKDLIDMGVDGVITNYPGRMRRIAAQYE